MLRRCLVAGVFATTMAILSAACSATGHGTPATDESAISLSALASSMAAVETAAYEISIAGDGEEIFSFDGVIDWPAQAWTVRADISPILPFTSGDATYDMIRQNDTVYAEAPFLRLLGVERDWISIDVTKSPDPAGPAGLITDPADVLDRLARYSAGVERTETASLDGISTVVYRSELEAAKIVGENTAIGEIVGELKIPVSIFVDSDNRIRRTTFELDMAEYREELQRGRYVGAEHVVVTFDYSKFGEPAHIEIPEPANVVDLTRLVEDGVAALEEMGIRVKGGLDELASMLDKLRQDWQSATG